MRNIDIAKELEYFAASPFLQELGDLLDDFNIFEEIGMTSQEIRHSAFLAFLLSPGESHGMRDQVLKALLYACGVEKSWLETIDLSEAEVTREWNNIDVLACDLVNRIVLLIENKIYTGEHGDQLARYYSIVEDTYPGCRIVAVYLTRTGSIPSHTAFRPLSYADLCKVLEEVTANSNLPIRPIVRTTIEHYLKMIRKYIVDDAEIKQLCADVYRKHKSAIDMIIRNIPVREVQFRDLAISLVEGTEGLKINHFDENQYVSFVPDSWLELRERGFLQLTEPDRWVKTGQPLYFLFHIQRESLQMVVQIRNCTGEQLKRLTDIAHSHTRPFNCYKAQGGNRYITIYRKTVLSRSDLESEALDILLQKLEDWWIEFTETDLKEIEQIFVAGLQPTV